MIEELDAQLSKWVDSVLPDKADVFLGPPAAQEAGARPRVGLYLFELIAGSASRGDPSRIRQIVARYLVTTWASRPEEEHKLLGSLLAAAVSEGKELDLTPLAGDTWAALGLPPRPCFVLDEALLIERPAEKAPLVRELPIVRAVGTTVLEGRVVVGPRRVPIARAEVAHLGIGTSATTDANGWFRFPLAPGGGTSPHRLEVQAKGVKRLFTVEAGAGAPINLQLELTEG